MEEKIKEMLKKYGLNESDASKIKVDSEDQIEEAVIDLKVGQQVKTQLDTEVQKALKSRETEMETRLREEVKKELEANNPPPADPGKKKPDDDKNEELANLIKQQVESNLKPLMEKVNALETQTVQEQRTAAIRSKLKEKGLSEDFSTFINVDKEDDIPAAVDTFAEKVQSVQQAEIDKALANAGVPKGSRGQANPSSELFKQLAETKNNPTESQQKDFGSKSIMPKTRDSHNEE